MPLLQSLILAAAAASLAVLLVSGERTGNARVKWIFKPVTSASFLLVAFLQAPRSAYDWLVLGGLLLSAVGDVALIPKGRRWFLAGLVAFLLGHVAYTIAFSTRAALSSIAPLPMAVIIATGIGLFLHFRPHLGRMLWPVAAYMAVITLMLMGAWAALDAGGAGSGGQVALAATLFYLSDITVARARFLPGTGFANRAIGLPLYYAAQFLFAFSIGSP